MPGEAARDYITQMADPELQQLILDAEATFGPQYVQQELARNEAALFGTDEQEGLIQLAARSAPIAEQMRADVTRSQREADIADVEALGGRATEALRQSDPARLAILEQQQELVGGLFDRAQRITPQQTRMAQQSAREAFQDRGREFDNSSIFSEALGRDELMRQNRAEYLNAAGGLFGQLQATSADPFQSVLGRPATSLAYNQATAAQALGQGQNVGPGLFNPDAGVNLALQNNANSANYNAAVYGAQAANRGSTLGGLFTGLGQIGGSAFGLGGLFGKGG